MKKMEWVIDNWYVLLALIACGLVLIGLVLKFFNMPTEKQIQKVKEWLVWACIEAEKELQSGTGQLKLRKVYDMFCAVPAFEWVAKVISFETFSEWVTESLDIAKELLTTNKQLANYVYSNKAEMEVKKLIKQLDSKED